MSRSQFLRLSLTNLTVQIYAAVHFWAWNGSFASNVEHLLWRIGCIVLVSATMLFWMVDRPIGWYHSGQPHVLAQNLVSSIKKIRSQSRNQSSEPNIAHESEKDTKIPRKRGKRYPLPEAFFMFVLGVVYIVSRAYLIVEAFAGLRELPSSAFQNVQWSDVLPHI